jgi:FMN phosphatase YigB (HAD superfamily)
MEKKIVYFDFDRTLLNTDALKIEQTKRIAGITNLSIIQIEEGMRLYVESIKNHLDFTPEGYAEYLSKEYGCNLSDVLKIYITDSNYIGEYLYPEVLGVLEELKKIGYSLGIFSAAMPGPQRLKISRTGVFEFTEEHLIIIDPRKLGIEVLEQLPDGVIIVDDDLQVIEKLQRHSPRFVPIWCNRKNQDDLPKTRTIHSLKELPNLLDEINRL